MSGIEYIAVGLILWVVSLVILSARGLPWRILLSLLVNVSGSTMLMIGGSFFE